MIWKIEFSIDARKYLKNLDKNIETQIIKYLKKIEQSPKSFGKPLVGNKNGLWRYRVGDYRIICNIQDNILTVIILDIGHRSEIYK